MISQKIIKILIKFHDFEKISSISGRGAEKTAKSTVSGAPGAAKMVEIHEIFIKFHEFS